MSREKMKPEESIDFHIRWAWYNISRMYNLQANAFGGSMAIGYALLNIEPEGTPSTKLAPKMGMEPRSLTRMIKSLEEKGFITKETDPTDKRLVKLFLTKTGKQQRKLAKSVVLTFNEKVYKEIPKEDLETTFRVIAKVNKLIDNNEVFN
jgi:DNA-binding MarR family transcriptional regulator